MQTISHATNEQQPDQPRSILWLNLHLQARLEIRIIHFRFKYLKALNTVWRTRFYKKNFLFSSLKEGLISNPGLYFLWIEVRSKGHF